MSLRYSLAFNVENVRNYIYWVDTYTYAGGLLLPGGIIRPVYSQFFGIDMLNKMYLWLKLTFLYNVIYHYYEQYPSDIGVLSRLWRYHIYVLWFTFQLFGYPIF